jgi:hypothetical protein
MNVKLDKEYEGKFNQLRGVFLLEALNEKKYFKATNQSTLESLIDFIWKEKIEPKKTIGFKP